MSRRRSEADRSPNAGREARFLAAFRRGTELLLAGEAEKAIESLMQARALDADHVQAALNLSGAYILTKRFRKAIALLETLAERAPENPAVWQNLS